MYQKMCQKKITQRISKMLNKWTFANVSEFCAKINKKQLSISFIFRILEQSMGARNRVGMGLPYQPARLHRLAVAGQYDNSVPTWFLSPIDCPTKSGTELEF
jgi:hypothetical protein